MEISTNFVKENTHYYGVDSETEKRAGTSGFYSNPYPRFASSNALIVRAKKYYLKPEVLQKLSDGKVSLQKNSKNSFSILTNTSFKIHDIEKTLSSFGESFMNGEGGFGIKFSQTKPNKIFVELDTIQGIKIIPLKIDESNKMKIKEYIQQEIKRQLNESEIDNVKINNPKTGRKIKLTTALGYDKSEKVYHVAKNYLKKNHPDANIDDLVDTDKSKGKSVDSENTNVLINKIYKTKDLNKLKSFYDKLDTKYDEGRALIKKWIIL